MEQAFKVAAGLLVMAATFAIAVRLGWRTLQKSEDPARLVFKWIVTIVLFGFVVFGALSISRMGAVGAFVVPIAGAVIGIFLGIMWAPNIGAMFAKPFTTLYDGGAAELEARPLYSIAHARRKQGKYLDAIAHVHGELLKFPNDYEGLMFLAEVYGDDLKDNNQAQYFVEEIIKVPGRAPKNIAYALNRSADWHLALASDRNAARAALERIPELIPDTEQAQTAWQRIARLTSDQMLAEKKERSTIALTRHDRKVGLDGGKIEGAIKPEDPAEEAAKLVAHLNDHPFDAEAREELAVIYAEHYQRLDLAADQLEQLINSPNPAQKQVVHWLNRLADFHTRIAGDRAGAEAALRRICERFPRTASAANAEKRIAFLDRELNKNTTSQAVKLGSYDQNIGLKGQVPRRP